MKSEIVERLERLAPSWEGAKPKEYCDGFRDCRNAFIDFFHEIGEVLIK